MAGTKINDDQISFLSSVTGAHDLGAYLESCELGEKTLAELLETIFDADTGLFKPVVWRGTYTNGMVLAVNDSVVDDHKFYLCTVAHTGGPTLDTSKFQLWLDFSNSVSDATAEAEGYADAAAASAAAAQTAETNAETAETNAETAETGAVAARNAAEGFRDEAEGFRDEAEASAVAAAASASGQKNYTAQTASFTAANKGLHTVEVTSADINIGLPVGTATEGDWFEVWDHKNTFTSTSYRVRITADETQFDALGASSDFDAVLLDTPKLRYLVIYEGGKWRSAR